MKAAERSQSAHGASVIGRISVPTARSSVRRGETARSAGPTPNAADGAEAKPTGKAAEEADQCLTQSAFAAVLANGLRRLMGESQRQCRLQRCAPTVQLVGISSPSAAERLGVEGVATCKSPLCPLCVRKWQRTRGEEIKQAIDYWEVEWGEGNVFFFTGTMKHHPGMNLALQHRLLTKAYGELWSGRAGQDFADLFGTKPESIRAHDRTASFEKGWHPHIHALLFFHRVGFSEAEYAELFDERWRESLRSALASLHKLIDRIVQGDWCRAAKRCAKAEREGRPSSERCDACVAGTECPNLRERARRVFGAKMIRRHEPLLSAVHRIAQELQAFTQQGIEPSKAHGVHMERVRKERGKGLDKYLTKLGAMGFELASGATKLGHEGSDGVVHYGPWELARIATIHGHPHRTKARRMWSELFKATFATQTITFSDRKKLGLGPDPYADEKEPEELATGEWKRLVGEVESTKWDELAKEQGHGLLITLAVAHAKGVLAELPWVSDINSRTWHGVPAPYDPRPPTGPPRPTYWQAMEAETKAINRGRATMRAVGERLARPPADQEFLEEVRERLERDNASAGNGRALPPGRDYEPRENFADVYTRDLKERLGYDSADAE